MTAKQTVTRKQMFQEGVNKETLVSSFTIQFDVKHACSMTASLDKLPRRYLNYLPVEKNNFTNQTFTYHIIIIHLSMLFR